MSEPAPKSDTPGSDASAAPKQDAPLVETPRMYRQFTGRNWLPPEPPKVRRLDSVPTGGVDSPAAMAGPAAALAAGAKPAVNPPPLAITRAERELMFQRYADLRQKLGASPQDTTVLVESARLAEELDLVLEAMEMWQECLRLDPTNPEAKKRLGALDRRAAATGETGRVPANSYKPKELAPEATPFWSNLPSVLSFPFRGKGFGVIVAGALCFALFEIMATFNVFVGGLMVLAIWGYLAGWQFDVISRSAAGKDDPADFPEFATIVDSCVTPVFAYIGCTLFSFAPAGIALFATFKGWLPAGAGLIVSLALVLACAFVFPMSLTVRALFQSTTEAMTPSRVYGAILRVLPDYILAYVSLAILWSVWGVTRVMVFLVLGLVFGMPTPDAVFALDFVRIFGWLVYTVCVWPLLLYVWAVQGHILGCLYRQSYRRLAWFAPPTPETTRAQQMTGPIVLAGVAGAVVLAGGLFLMWKMGPGGAGAAVVNGGGTCPIPANATLTYFWENTDGPAGLATYTFSPAENGKLHVAVKYVKADQFGVMREEDTIGLIDPSSGVVVRYDGERGGLPQSEKANQHTRFYGPPRKRESGSYINDWGIRGGQRWMGRWDTVKVIEPDTSTELYYDKTSGILVGRKSTGIGFTTTEWLCDAQGLPNMTSLPAANRTFPAEQPAGDCELPFMSPSPDFNER